jgi:hypothetical protein
MQILPRQYIEPISRRRGRPPKPPIQRAESRLAHLNLAAGPVKSAFCGIETVSCVAGVSIDHVYEMVERGCYLWVWNVSSGAGSKRSLRFWSREINDPASVRKLKLDAVIQATVPCRAHMSGQFDGLRAWEFRHLLHLSKPTLHDMREELGICGTARNLFIPRANIEQFFRRRWIGKIQKKRKPSRFKNPYYQPKTWN